MARLPQVGGDDGGWGAILNEFLLAAHNTDGSLKPITQAQVDGLVSALGAKANTSHTHAIADVVSLQQALTDLQATLDTKQTILVHDGAAYPARPAGLAAGLAEYHGPTEPTGWLTGDTWVETP